MTPERQEKLLHVLSHRQNNLTVVMENVHDPHNIAAVMRTCDAVGIQDIYVLIPLFQGMKNLGPKAAAVLLNG